jgi:hypothetical protein
VSVIFGSPPALPGNCFKCSSASREAFYDLGMSIDFVGAVYLCNECVYEIARAFGMDTAEKVQGLYGLLEKKEEYIVALTEELNSVKGAFDGLNDLNEYLASGVPLSGANVPFVEPEEGFAERTVDVVDGEVGPAESSDDERVAVLLPVKSESSGSF